MQLDIRNTAAHLWITAFWCALGAVVLGAIAVISCWIRKCRTNRRKRKAALNKNVRRTNSANEFDSNALSAATRRQMYSRNRSASSEQDNSDQSEHSEKSPLVSARLDSLAKLFFNKSGSAETGSRETIESSLTRPNVKYQYTALDSGNGIQDRSPKERAARDRSLTACQEWVQNSNGRYDIIAHLDEIGSRHNKHWFLINDASVRTDRLMTLLPIPPDCVALQEELPPSESPKGLLMQLLGSLHHPYVYPVLDLGFLHTESISYACLVMPFNPRGSLRDLIYKAQWNEPYNRKYSRKSSGLPLTQIQRLGRQILEALLFLKERGFPLHGHLHSGNVILQNGVARLSGLENGLLGLHSRINAVLWSRSTNEIENIDILCFGYLLYEMCLGDELNTPNPTAQVLEMELERHPQILETLILIFDPPDGCCPTVEELVLCDLFRNIDLRELRGPCVSTIKPSFNKSTLSLLQAVKKRQTASLGGSFSETSSPCTPPSTPRDRRAGTADSFDISSDSDASLDEVVITSSSYDSHHYDPLSSPIHFCDNSLQSDDNSSAITTSALVSQVCEEAESSTSTSASTSTCSNNQLTTDMCNFNNSKSRRMEYSLRCMKYGRSNPSQDSAFGSLTDGELSIASSSFRLSSFQSITSPIDEGVEDTILSCSREANLEPTKSPGQNDSAISTPCRENSPCFGGDNDVVERGVMKNAGNSAAVGSLGNKSPFSPSASPRKHPTTVHLNPNQAFDPPKILLNDQSSIYTTSPSKKSGTIEVFSQKYRVSSFEDMSPNKKNLRNVNKLAFRSLEEEQRIDNAFVPIKDRTNSENRVYSINKNEKYKKLTHTSFAHRITAGNRDRYTMWRDSTFYRKTKIAKSNDSLLDSPKSRFAIADSDELKKGLNRGNSVAEISCSSIDCKDLASLKIDSRKSRSERHIFNLSKLKQTAINDFVSVDEFIQDNKSLSLGSTSFTQITLFKNLEEGSESNADSSEEHSPLHQDMCKYIGNTGDPSEEKTPLLENMEMSPISPTEPNETL